MNACLSAYDQSINSRTDFFRREIQICIVLASLNRNGKNNIKYGISPMEENIVLSNIGENIILQRIEYNDSNDSKHDHI